MFMLYSLCSMQFCINKSNLVCAHLCPSFCGAHERKDDQMQARRLVGAERQHNLVVSQTFTKAAIKTTVHHRPFNFLEHSVIKKFNQVHDIKKYCINTYKEAPHSSDQHFSRL